MIRVVLADDQSLVRAGFRMILSSDPQTEVVGEASDGREAIAVCRASTPDVVLLDVRMPTMDGLAAAEAILKLPSPPKVLMLTTFQVDDYVYDALRMGASGYLLKDVGPDDLIAAVHSVVTGDLPLAPAITRHIVEHFVDQRRPRVDAALASLSPREQEILACLGRGQNNAEIGAQLYLSLSTVKTHVASILTKLGVRDRVQAAIRAHQAGLV